MFQRPKLSIIDYLNAEHVSLEQFSRIVKEIKISIKLLSMFLNHQTLACKFLVLPRLGSL